MKNNSLFIVFVFYFLFFIPFSTAFAEDKNTAKQLAQSEDAIGRTIRNDYTFTDQDGNAFNLKEFSGKPFIVSFIYTSCPYICPTILGNLNNAVKKSQGLGKEFNVLTIGFDDVNDTPDKLKAYGSQFTDDFIHWRFVTADKKTIQDFARGFGFYYKKEGNFFDHLNMVSIVDAKARIFTHIYGIDFTPDDVIKPVNEIIKNPDAKPIKNQLAKSWWNPFVNTVKLLCSTYNPVTKQYDFDITQLVRMLVSGGTILVIIFFVWGKDIKTLLWTKKRLL
ncbi:MAG: SCO family protein [Deltaproteobacteria bacterium]|nr:SCO family protein [Deltaproteobacteria bacterium]